MPASLSFARRIAGLMLIAAVMFGASAAHADKMIQHKIADGVYMMQNDRGSSNSTFFITPDGVLMFDADIKTADQVLPRSASSPTRR